MAGIPITGRKARTGCNEIRENAIFWPEDAPSGDKTKSSHRRTGLPATKCNLLAGGRALRQQNAIFSSESMSSSDKMQSSRPRTRPPATECNLLVGERVLRQVNDVFSSAVYKEGENMHPLGVEFGLSRGLLQLRGDEVLLSDQLLEAISVEAQKQLQLGRPPDSREFPC